MLQARPTFFSAEPLRLHRVGWGASVQICFLINLNLGHSRTFTELSWSFVILCFGSLSCWKIRPSPTEAGYHHGCIAAFIFPSTPTGFPLPAAEKRPLSMMLPPPCFTVETVLAWFPADMTLCIQAIEFDLCFIGPENYISRGLRVFQLPFVCVWYPGLVGGALQKWFVHVMLLDNAGKTTWNFPVSCWKWNNYLKNWVSAVVFQ